MINGSKKENTINTTTMKTKLILFLAILCCGFIQSQEINCASTQEEFSKLVENQNYKEA